MSTDMIETPPTSKVGEDSVLALVTNSNPPPISQEISPMAARRVASGSCSLVSKRGNPGAQPAPLIRSVRYGAIY